MTAPEQTPEAQVSLEQLIALNDEIAALVRAGVPLASGLGFVGRDLPGRLGQIATTLAARLQAGQPLPQAIAAEPGVFPPVYREVVAAGLAAGRLPAALEGLSTSLRRVADVRRMTGAALVYPLLVLVLVYALFVYSFTMLQPSLLSAYQSFDAAESRVSAGFLDLPRIASDWGPWLPLAVVATVGWWWYRSGRRGASTGAAGARWTGRFWPAARLAAYGRLANFADVLALLVDHDVPLHQALPLAARASGDGQLVSAAAHLADGLHRGRELSNVDSGFPPLVGWLLASGHNQPALASSLRSVAESYRRRARRLEDGLSLFLPIVTTLAIGGTAVTIYAFSVFVPWYSLMREIAAMPQ